MNNLSSLFHGILLRTWYWSLPKEHPSILMKSLLCWQLSYFLRSVQDIVLTVIQGTVLSPDEICGFVLGDNCATPFDPLGMWNITISDKPKPPVRPHVRPKVHCPDLVFVLLKVNCPDSVLVLPRYTVQISSLCYRRYTVQIQSLFYRRYTVLIQSLFYRRYTVLIQFVLIQSLCSQSSLSVSSRSQIT